MRLLRVIFAAAALWIASAHAAKADPVSITLAIAGVASWTSAIASSVAVAISLGASLLLRKKPKSIGQKLDLTIGGDQPLSVGFGTYATSGQLVYPGSWGKAGKTPNAYLTYVIQLGDAPIDGMNALYVNGERVTISGAAEAQGTPVTQYRVEGKDHLWVKFYDGNQTTADPFLASTFGSAARPWDHNFVGRGRPYAIVTMKYNREVFNSVPQFLFELRGIRVYDPRQDTTVGGDGAQREDDPSTWAWSDNAVLIARQILRGVRWQDEWLYGGQTISGAGLPASAWIAAANEEFTAGGEVECDIEPADALELFMQATGGRIAEIGGIYKPRTQTPPAPVWSFTDDDIIITEGQQFEPFEGLQQRHNKIVASYSEPAEAWTPKPAPPRIDAEGVARERGKELTKSLDLRVVYKGDQAQQLMAAALKSAQRQRQHRFSLPPIAWLLEPGDTVVWTSARNGYEAKQFTIEEMAGRRTFIHPVALREIDPADYDWAPEDVIPVETHPITIIRPTPQPMTGFQVFPASYEDAAGNGYPSIEVRYELDLDDVKAVRIQVRTAVDPAMVFDGELPYDGDVGAAILNGVFLPATDYQVRGRFIPFSGRATTWSAWLDVTTPDTRFISEVNDGAVTLEKLGEDAANILADIYKRARQLEGEARSLGQIVGEMALQEYSDRQLIRQELKVEAGNLRAGYTNAIFAAVGPGSVLAGQITTIEAALADAETGIDALGSGLASLVTRVDTAEGAISVNTSDIVALEAGLTAAEGDIVATASALSALDTRVTAAEGAITSQASQIDTLETDLEDAEAGVAANATALSGLDVRVTNAEADISAQASSMIAIETDLAALGGDVTANASAISALDTRVDDVEGDVSAFASALIGVNAATGGNFANARFGMQASATPSDALARIGMRVAASGGGSLVEAGLFIDALSGGQSRVVVAADKFAIQSGVNSRYAPFLVDGGVVYIDRAVIRNLTAENWDSNAGVSMGVTSTSDIFTKSATGWENVPNFTGLTRVFDEDCVAVIHFQATANCSNSSGRILTRLLNSGPDGARTLHGGLAGIHFGNGDRDQPMSGFTMARFSAGTHSFTLQWDRVAGSSTITMHGVQLGIIAYKGASFSGLTGNPSDTGGGGGAGGGDWRGGGLLPF